MSPGPEHRSRKVVLAAITILVFCTFASSQSANALLKGLSKEGSLLTLICIQSVVSTLLYWYWTGRYVEWRKPPPSPPEVRRPFGFLRPQRMFPRAVLVGLWAAASAYASVYVLQHMLLGAALALWYFFGPMALATWVSWKYRRWAEAIWPVVGLGGVLMIARPGVSGVDGVGIACVAVQALAYLYYANYAADVADEDRIAFTMISKVVTMIALNVVLAVEIVIRGVDGYLPPSEPFSLALICLCAILSGFLPILLINRAWGLGMGKDTFGVLGSCEPAIGAGVALVLLGEALSAGGWAGAVVVFIAASGAAWSASRRKPA